MSLPWGANFAVYGRRNVAPSITQYDFAEFVKGGRVDHRLKRSVLFDSQELLGASYLNAVSFTTLSSENSNQKVQNRRTIAKQHEGTGGITNYNKSKDISSNDIWEEQVEEIQTKLSNDDELSKQNQSDTHYIIKRSSSSSSGSASQSSTSSQSLPSSSSSSTSSASTMAVNVTLLQYLDTGRWFLSVYNDDLRSHEVVLIVEEAEGISTACPNDCSGHGSCYLGKCDCIDGYEGIDCSKSKLHY